MKPDASSRRAQDPSSHRVAPASRRDASESRRDAAAARRDAGLALISRINRWMVAGAIGLAGLISIAAKGSFHGHSQATAAQSTRRSSIPSTSSGSESLQQPAQAPTPVPVAPAPVVSGGS